MLGEEVANFQVMMIISFGIYRAKLSYLIHV